MTSKLNINWLNKCRCGNRMHTVETVRGSHVRLFEDDAVKCNSCGRKGVIQTFDGIATVLWETDDERAEGAAMTKSTITRERMSGIARGEHCYTHDDVIELARMALAAMDSEPVKRVNADQMHRVCLEANRHLDKYGAMAKEVNKLLGRIPAQPAPVVPDGWVMVPKEPTEDMVIAGFESRPDEGFSEPEIWDEYQNMSGCQQAAHRARLCWAAMLAAAPQEVPDGK